jgi:hypothetical protein
VGCVNFRVGLGRAADLLCANLLLRDLTGVGE